MQFDLAKAQGRLDQMRHWADALKGSQWDDAVYKQIEDVERESQSMPQAAGVDAVILHAAFPSDSLSAFRALPLLR